MGDILLKPIAKIEDLKSIYKGDSYVLAYGEVTGHKHLLIAEPETSFEVLVDNKGNTYIQMSARGKLTHEEHKEITILPDFYVVGNEKEYNYFGLEIQRVID